MSVTLGHAPTPHDDPRPQTAPVRVLIADDHPLIVAGIRRTIENLPDIEVVGEAHSGGELLQLIERRRPTVVTMDVQMDGVDGAGFIATVHRHHPAVKIVVLSDRDDRATIDAALHAGASAYVLKNAQTVDIAAVLRQTTNGAIFHAPSPAPTAAAPAARLEPPALTDRERAVLAAVAAGLTTAAISRELWVSEHTVKFHLTNIYRKLGVANRASAVRYALEHGLVDR